ncbi:hypothetical protein BX661DRAFT_181669, partial [Kickxella alabastrina]|uniref:uncharacterized protein n=1 Tax=Kickxella alabastrina TaxID=61397 RepID=UPI00221E97D6
VAMAAPRGLSVRTASLAPSLASSPVESQRSPTPVGSPHPVEAARMLRQVMDQPRMPPPPTIDPDLQAAQQQQQQRMSTWSASSARTLADDTAGRGRVIARHRVAADLGLSVRSELERRVRSFSASEPNAAMRAAARPHSSMGFLHSPRLLRVSDKLSLSTLRVLDDNDNDNDSESMSSVCTERVRPSTPVTPVTGKRRAQTISTTD